MSLRQVRLAALLLLGGGALTACDNAGSDLGFATQKQNVVRALVFLDRDGSHSLNAPTDTVYRGARVVLLQRGTTDTVASALSDGLGIALISNVNLGDYTVAVSPTGLGDSVSVTSVDTSLVLPPSNQATTNIKVQLLRDTTDVLVRLSYPEISLRQARAAAAGKRVFVRGVVLAPYPLFRDGSAFISDTSGPIRLTSLTLRGGLGALVPGDSVTVLGVTSSSLGQAILDQAIVTRLTSRPAPFPSIITSGSAATANSGALDAAFVQVNSILISDTATVSPDFKITGSDGTGAVAIILDANISFNRNLFVPGGPRINVKGMLVPDGAGGWSVKPRAPVDIF
jgi:hypothetical protein